MSRRSWQTPDGKTVTVGHDRPLQYFHLTVEGPELIDGEEALVFDCMAIPDPEWPKSLREPEWIFRALGGMKIDAPPTLLDDLIRDRAWENSNGRSMPKEVRYGTVGV